MTMHIYGAPETVAKLQEDLKVAYAEMLRAKSQAIRAEVIAEKFSRKYIAADKVWRTLDKQLAMLDGRYKIEEPFESGKRPKVVKKLKGSELDIETLKRLASDCGIDLGI